MINYQIYLYDIYKTNLGNIDVKKPNKGSFDGKSGFNEEAKKKLANNNVDLLNIDDQSKFDTKLNNSGLERNDSKINFKSKVRVSTKPEVVVEVNEVNQDKQAYFNDDKKLSVPNPEYSPSVKPQENDVDAALVYNSNEKVKNQNLNETGLINVN